MGGVLEPNHQWVTLDSGIGPRLEHLRYNEEGVVLCFDRIGFLSSKGGDIGCPHSNGQAFELNAVLPSSNKEDRIPPSILQTSWSLLAPYLQLRPDGNILVSSSHCKLLYKRSL